MSEVTSPLKEEDRMIHKVVQTMQPQMPQYTPDAASPPAPRPIPKSLDLEKAKAERVGSHDSALVEDIGHAFKMARSTVTGESIWARIGKAVRGANILNRKKAQKASMSSKDYKSDLDVGE